MLFFQIISAVFKSLNYIHSPVWFVSQDTMVQFHSFTGPLLLKYLLLIKL